MILVQNPFKKIYEHEENALGNIREKFMSIINGDGALVLFSFS